MTNLNLIKLIIGMQLELRTIVQKASDMETTLEEIMAGVERIDPPTLTAPSQPPSDDERPYKRYANRATPEYRASKSQQQKAYWASEKGKLRRAEILTIAASGARKFWAGPEGQKRKAETAKRREERRASHSQSEQQETVK